MYDVIFLGNQLKEPSLTTLQVDPEALLSCRGRVGDFSLRYRDNGQVREEKTLALVANLDYEHEAGLAGFPTFIEDTQIPEEGNLIFIQDYGQLAPAHINRMGLEKALAAAKGSSSRQVYYFYRSLRFTEGTDDIYEEARQAGVAFFRYEEGKLKVEEPGHLTYNRGGTSMELEGQVLTAPLLSPSPHLEKLARILRLNPSEEGYLQEENVYLAPTLTGRRGVYALGGARNPNSLGGFEEEACYTLEEIAALKNDLQPLVEDEREVDDKKCILCYTCYRVCPHAALEENEEQDAMEVLQEACWGCNGCISHCPAVAISIVGEEEEEKKPGLQVLMCENSAVTARKKLPKNIMDGFISREISCACSLKKEDIYAYLEDSADRVLILGCFEESCKHLEGEQRGQRIVDEVNETLKSLDLGEERVRFERLSPPMEADMKKLLGRWREGQL